MSQDENKIANHDEATDEVEGHVKRAGVNDEGTAEGEGDDEVEAHVQRTGHARKQ
jgi:hypothetical protein